MSITPVEDNNNKNVTLQLHKREQNDYWNHPGIATVTFCTGDPQKCIQNLRIKLRTVLNANPWIAGRLVLDNKNVKTCVHPTRGSDALVDEILSIQNTTHGISRQSKYEDLVKKTGGDPALTVQNGRLTLKNKTLITKMVIVTAANTSNNSNDNNNKEFCIVFSMSHVVADGHDYYKIFNMIGGSAPVVALDPRRVAEYEAREPQWTGPSDFAWLSGGGLIKGVLSGLLFGPRAQWCCYMVDEGKINDCKRRAKSGGLGGGGGVSFVSTNDVITSHFFNAARARVGMMVVNMRDKISLPINDLNAGCYESCMLLDAENYADPSVIRKCLLGGVPLTRQAPSPPLPGFCGGACPMALITSWASFPFALELEPPPPLSAAQAAAEDKSSTNGSSGSGISSQLLHLPCMSMPDMMDVAIVFRPLPDKLAVIYLAKRATPESLTQSGNAWDCLGAAVDESIFPIKK